MAKVINFWLGKGIKGFRFDVIDMVGKRWSPIAMSNGPHLHDYIHVLNAASFGSKRIITVGETWGADLTHMQRYSNTDGSEFSIVFNFELLDGDDPVRISYRPSLANAHFGLVAKNAFLLMNNYPEVPSIIFAPYQACIHIRQDD